MSDSLNIKVSENFWLKEFLWSNLLNGYVDVNDVQFWLIKKMANLVLQTIRNEFGEMIITSGVRNKELIDIMTNNDDYSPSLTTDHAFLDPDVYQYGVGAVDFYLSNQPDLMEVQQWVMERALRKRLPIGQSIIYWNSKKEAFTFIHISLLRSVVFSKEFAYDNLKDYGKFLVGIDRGVGGYKQIYLKNGKLVAIPERMMR